MSRRGSSASTGMGFSIASPFSLSPLLPDVLHLHHRRQLQRKLLLFFLMSAILPALLVHHLSRLSSPPSLSPSPLQFRRQLAFSQFFQQKVFVWTRLFSPLQIFCQQPYWILHRLLSCWLPRPQFCRVSQHLRHQHLLLFFFLLFLVLVLLLLLYAIPAPVTSPSHSTSFAAALSSLQP